MKNKHDGHSISIDIAIIWAIDTTLFAQIALEMKINEKILSLNSCNF